MALDHRIGTCVKCSREQVEIAAFGLCFACYRAERRSLERGGAGLRRRLNRQPAALVKSYTRLMLAVADLDVARDGRLASWVSGRVGPLIEPIQQFIKNQPSAVDPDDCGPTIKQRFRSFHQVTTALLALGATEEMIAEIQTVIREQWRPVIFTETTKQQSSRSRSRRGPSTSQPDKILPFCPPHNILPE